MKKADKIYWMILFLTVLIGNITYIIDHGLSLFGQFYFTVAAVAITSMIYYNFPERENWK